MQTTSDSEYVNVYILTKNGNEYRKENEDVYFILSNKPITMIHGKENTLAAFKAQNDFPNNTSWETLSKVFTDYE